VKVLLDTHVVIWWLEDATRLSRRATSILENMDNVILISAAVGWELAIKVNAGKLKPRSVLDSLSQIIDREAFSEQPITLQMAVRAGLLPHHHRDPFDRMLVAQCQVLSLPILSADVLFDRYDVKRLW
jgi:PIN domain nuclease of toxin-antitoxin system